MIGYGEIGKAIYEVFGEHHEISIHDPKQGFSAGGCDYDLMLVCIPYDDKFVEGIKGYIEWCEPKATIIFSTVQIGTTSQIPNAVHCPIEGKHPNLTEYIKRWQIFMGGYNELAYEFFRKSFKYPTIIKKSEHTEALKMLSTSFYGIMLEYTRYVKDVCNYVGMNFNDYNMYNHEYNSLYKQLGIQLYLRPLLTPPKGNIGGHCVVPNSKLLDEKFPSIFLKEIYRDKERSDEHD